MSLKKRTYSILVVSAAENFTAALTPLLSPSDFFPVHCVSSISAAKRAAAEFAFDLAVVNLPLPDDSGVQFAVEMSASRGAAVLLLAKAELQEELFDRVSEHGVFLLSKPVSRQTMEHGLRWLISARELLRRYERKTLSFEEKMEEIRMVNRAKWLLISEEEMEEPAAHRYIEKEAMNRCVSRKEIAAEIIKKYQ